MLLLFWYDLIIQNIKIHWDYLYLMFWLDLWLLATLGTHNQAISSLILAGSDIRAITYNTIIASIIGILLTWFLIPYYDVGATVIGYVVYCLIQIVFYYFFYWPKVMKISSAKVFFSSFLPYTLAGGLVCFGLRNLTIGNVGIWPILLLKGGIFCIVYIILTFFLLKKEDKKFVMGIIRKF